MLLSVEIISMKISSRSTEKRSISNNRLLITFQDKLSVGDGVCKDAYAGFFEAVYEKFEGHFEKIPSSNVDDDELEIIGKIITHAYVTQAIFPLQICSLALKYYLFGDVVKMKYYQVFFNFLPRNETELIKVFIRNEGDVQPISDILTEYSIFTLPTKENIKGLCVRAGRAALIRKPCYTMQRLISGMGKFWKSCTKSILDAVLMSVIPDSELFNNRRKYEGRRQDYYLVAPFYKMLLTVRTEPFFKIYQRFSIQTKRSRWNLLTNQ